MICKGRIKLNWNKGRGENSKGWKICNLPVMQSEFSIKSLYGWSLYRHKLKTITENVFFCLLFLNWWYFS